MLISVEFTVITDSDAFRVSSNRVVLHKGWNYFAGLCIIFFLLFSGFLISKNKVPDWWIWVYYISPLQWAITAIVCNEFLSDRYSQVSEILQLNSQSHSSCCKFLPWFTWRNLWTVTESLSNFLLSHERLLLRMRSQQKMNWVRVCVNN